MPIEFRCPQCGKLLRTPDGTAGRQAKCPQCETLTMIPQPEAAAAMAPVPDLPPMSPPPSDSQNPYSSPTPGQMLAAPGPVQRGFNPTRIDLGSVLSDSWQIYKANLWPCFGANLLVFILNYAISFVMTIATVQQEEAVRVSVSILNIIPGLWLTLGMLIFMLKVARGEGGVFSSLFSGGPYLLTSLGVAILWWIAMTIGFLLLIIPGIIVFFMFAPAFFMVVDQNVGVMDAFSMARRATAGNKLTMFALAMLLVLFSVLGLLACGVGLLFVQPFAMLTYAVGYLAMTGQSIAVPQRP